MKKTSLISDFTKEEQTPTVRLLLTFFEQQQEQIEALKTEVTRLKKLPKKPIIRSSTLPKDDDQHDDADDSGQTDDNQSSTGSSKRRRKRKKSFTIHKREIFKLKMLPVGSRLLGYQNYILRDLLLESH